MDANPGAGTLKTAENHIFRAAHAISYTTSYSGVTNSTSDGAHRFEKQVCSLRPSLLGVTGHNMAYNVVTSKGASAYQEDL